MKRYLLLLLSSAWSFVSTAQLLTTAQAKQLLNTKPGSVVTLDSFMTQHFPSLNYQKIVAPGPQFLISDDPEYIRVPEAVVLQERVQPGAVRLYLYNVNGVIKPEKIDRKITALIKNKSNAAMHLRMLRYASQKPTTNYFKAGKEGLSDHFLSDPGNIIKTIKPGEVIPIDEVLEKSVVKYDELRHGIYEFVIDQPGEVSVLQTAPGISGPLALQKMAAVHPVNGKNAGRGLFGVSNYKVNSLDTIDTKNGPLELILADGQNDPWIIGTESTSGPTKNVGNYGVMYEVVIHWKSSDKKALALLTWNARAGDNKWCRGMANAMLVSEGLFKAGVIQLPSDALRTKGAPEAILIQVFTPSLKEEIQTIRFTYSPPGASCLPTPLIFVPVDWENK